ncbi:hypothetical protein Glove_104g31 [Diversispora epigaea]|uniref:Uncharacterized protein n=1 Tax=Diversispora epigaea TaxID=1348612 RepID=A0A397J314_9GLOM|nr:hypothetical protein Glove_104g31 [Diversispora epigaea]
MSNNSNNSSPEKKAVQNNKKRKRTMQESQTITKKKTSKISKTITQTMKSSKKLVQASTTNARNFKPNWNEFTKEMSQRLLLPTKTNSVTVDLNSLNSSSRRLTQYSWFSVKALKNEAQQDELFIICNCFVAKNNRLHSAKNRKKCRQAQRKETKNDKQKRRKRTCRKNEKK